MDSSLTCLIPSAIRNAAQSQQAISTAVTVFQTEDMKTEATENWAWRRLAFPGMTIMGRLVKSIRIEIARPMSTGV